MHTSTLGRPPAVILPVQYLRGVAALMVVWHHAVGQVAAAQEHIAGHFGKSGVDLFFVISGFIMVISTSGSPQGPMQFLRRRVLRVVPMYWMLTLLMVGVALAAPNLFKTLKLAPETLIQSLLFIPHYSQSFPEFVYPLLVPGWSLNMEMFFYAVFALSMCLPARGRLATLSAGLLALVVIGLGLGPMDSAMARTYTSPLLIEFVGGAWLAVWWLRRTHPLPLRTSILIIVIGTVLLAFPDSPPLGQFTQILGALLVVAGALDPRFQDARNHTLHQLGNSSYSLYLTHVFTLGVMRVLWAKLGPAASTVWTGAAFMAASMLACAVVGWWVYEWVETPLLRRLSGPGRGGAAMPTSRVAPAGDVQPHCPT